MKVKNISLNTYTSGYANFTYATYLSIGGAYIALQERDLKPWKTFNSSSNQLNMKLRVWIEIIKV